VLPLDHSSQQIQIVTGTIRSVANVAKLSELLR